jgi:hypothetical protein
MSFACMLTAAPATTTPEATLTLETQTCSRCGGCGQYSYCQMYGTRCFKCCGAGKVYTKRGLAAKAYLDKICSVPVESLAVGDTVRAPVLGGGYKFARIITLKVYTQEDCDAGTKCSSNGGPFVNYHNPGDVEITTAQMVFGVRAGELVRKGWDAATKRAKLVEAIAYQETLTKLGKPRKR